MTVPKDQVTGPREQEQMTVPKEQEQVTVPKECPLRLSS